MNFPGLFRDVEIIIPEKPASSLDAIAEMEIFTKFREIIQGRLAVLISHRFSTVLMADRIYVLEGAAHHGNQSGLMAQNGRYSTRFLRWLMPTRNLQGDTNRFRILCNGIFLSFSEQKYSSYLYIIRRIQKLIKMVASKELSVSDSRVVYTPPCVVRMKDLKQGAGQCAATGSGDIDGCYRNGNSASGGQGTGCYGQGNSPIDE